MEKQKNCNILNLVKENYIKAKKQEKKESEYVWTCDYCGKEFDTKKESDRHELNCKENPLVNKRSFLIKIILLILSLIIGGICLFVIYKLSSNSRFGSEFCLRNSKYLRLILILGEFIFIVFNHCLFSIIKSVKLKNKISIGFKKIFLGGQVLIFLLFFGVGIVAIYAYSDSLCKTTPIQVIGRSMEPTFKDQQLLTELAFENKQIKRGCIVLLKDGTYQNQKGVVIKRVIGLPGETIRISNEGVFINTEKLDEPYIQTNQNNVVFNQELKIPENNYFLMGDNREHSQDSREFGPVSIDRIDGFVLDPINQHLNLCE